MRYATDFCIAAMLALYPAAVAVAQSDSAIVVRITIPLDSRPVHLTISIDCGAETSCQILDRVPLSGDLVADQSFENSDDSEQPDYCPDQPEAEGQFIGGSALVGDTLSVPGQSDVAERLSELRGLYDYLGEYNRAESLVTGFVASIAQAREFSNPDIVESSRGFAQESIDQAGCAEEEMVLARARAIIGQTNEPIKEIIGKGDCALARFGRQQERLDRADSIIGRAIDIYKAGIIPDSIGLAGYLDRLGVVDRAREQYRHSRSIIKRLFGLVKKLLGFGKEEKAIGLVNLANLYYGRGEARVGIALLCRVLAGGSRESDANPRLHIDRVDSLPSIYIFRADRTRSERLFRRSREFIDSTSAAGLSDYEITRKRGTSRLMASLGALTDSYYRPSAARKPAGLVYAWSRYGTN